jgi:Tol biopolymer transport system component
VVNPGTRLGAYEILSSLGAGGMGEVYRAVDSNLGRHVAIKVLPDAFAEDPERLSRFDREARTLAALNHPNIAAIYGLERSASGTALVMELVEGPTLADRIALGAIPLDEAIPVATQIAEALEAAHDHNIIHRDLKPANIKVRPDGTVKVLDFGLAKLNDPNVPNAPNVPSGFSMSPTIVTPAMTQAGVILGTAAYMSPEQARGRPADRRSDLWAFGCVVYEMLTGARPFAGDEVADTLAAVLRADPNWQALPPSTPNGLRRLLRLCLERDPRKRLQSAGDARIRLAEAADADGAPLVESRTAARTRIVWLAAAIALAVLAGAAGGYALRQPADVEPREQRTEIVTPATFDPNSFAISPDGGQVLFVAATQGTARLWLRSLGATTARPLPDTDQAVYPFWSPDSRSVAFFAEGKLKRLDLGSSKSLPLADVVGMRGGTWNSDGTVLYAAGTVGTLFRVPATGGTPAAVGTLAKGQSNHRFPVFLPDGRQFLYFAVGTADTQGIYLGSLDAPTVTRLTAAASAGNYLPGGWLVWVREGVLVAQRLDLEQRRLVGEPVTVADELTYDGTTFVPGVSISATGAMVYRAGGEANRELRWFDPAGRALEALGMPDSYLINPRVAPDGARAVAFRTVEGNSDLWLYDKTRTTRVTNSPASEQFAVWSPDGRQIVYRSNKTGVYNLFVTSVASLGSERSLLDTPRDKVANDWSPDGKYLTFQDNDPQTGNAWNLWATPVDGSREPFVILSTTADERSATFSPDSQWLAYISNQSGRYEVYVRRFIVPADTPADAAVPYVQVSTAGGAFPKWRSDGRALFYQSLDGQVMIAPIAASPTDVQAGTPVTIFRPSLFGSGTDVNLGRQWDVASDGRFLANVVRDVTSSLVFVQHWSPPRR